MYVTHLGVEALPTAAGCGSCSWQCAAKGRQSHTTVMALSYKPALRLRDKLGARI